MIFFKVLKSESIKRKGSSLNWLIVGGSFFIPFIILISRLLKHQQTVMQNSTEGVWMKLFNLNWQYMAILLLPMGIALATSLLNQIEYRNNTWKQLMVMPVNSSSIFLSKYITLIYILVQYFVLFTIGIYLTGLIPALIYSDVIYPKEAFPFDDYLKKSTEYFIDSLPVIAIQFLLSFHIRNYIVSIGVGFTLLIGSLIAMNWESGYLLPYSYAALDFIKTDNKINPDVHLQKWALAYFILVSALNYILFLYRSHITIALIKKGCCKKEIFLVSTVLIISIAIVTGLNYIESVMKKSPSANDDEVTNKKIERFENNLGAFKITNNKDWTIEERMKHYNVPGLSIAVINNYRIEWAKGYGFADKSTHTLVDTNTLFIPGSLSKSLNAMGIMKLVQDNKLNLFTDINKYLVSWKFPYDHITGGKIINTAHLLSHTGGTSVHGFMGYKPTDSLPDIFQILEGSPSSNSEPVKSIAEPGKRFMYSGGGVLITQLLVSDITGDRYDDYMKKTVFAPLNMKHTSFTQYNLNDGIHKRAVGYDTLGHEIAGKFPILPEMAAGGVWTTPSDMCKFIIEVQKSLNSKSNKILKQNYTDMMLTPYMNEESALGFFIKNSNGYQYFGHDAGNRGFSGLFYGSIKDGYGLAIFINSENSDILREVMNAIINEYKWPGFEPKKSIKVTNPNGAVKEKYIGTYYLKDEVKDTTSVKITKKDNDLFYCIGRDMMKMYFTSDTKFINNESNSEKEFKLGTDGKVSGIYIKKNSKLFYLEKR
ncbi:MAG: serine hydrolase [Limnohabitans sp.]|nr:serine hydrolase [Limnohabitans sp.]